VTAPGNDELGRMWKKPAVAVVRCLSADWLGETKYKHSEDPDLRSTKDKYIIITCGT
jgi:hypothetical protein